MLDYINLAPVPEALKDFIQSALRGQAGPWPEAIGPAEMNALEEHGLIPLLFASSRLPALKEKATEAAAIEVLRLENLRVVLQALQPVAPLILKGTALAYSLYAAPEFRPRSDTDLLIDRRGLETASDLLAALGFASLPQSGDELGMRQMSFWRTDRLGVEHVYDIHWSISNHAVFADVMTYAELRERAIDLPKIGSTARGLSPVDALLMACIHRIAHHHGSERLIWLFDIQLIRKAMTTGDHAAFWRLAKERQVLAVCSESMRAADRWFGDSNDEELTQIGESSREPSRVFLDRTRRSGSFLIADLLALPGWSARSRRLVDLVLPSRAYMSHQFGTRNPFLLPVLYAFRAVRGLTRLFRRVA